MNSFVAAITQTLTEATALSFIAAAIWGVMSVFLSPCHLGSIPLIVAYINDSNSLERTRAFRLSLMFGLGILITLCIIGVITSIAGRILGDIGPITMAIIGGFLVLCGLWLMDVPPFDRINFTVNAQPKNRGAIGAFSLGLIFGIVLGPCSFAFLAPMIGLVFSSSVNEVSFGILLMLFYALGHTGAIVAAGTFGSLLTKVFARRNIESATRWIKRVCGFLVSMFGGWKLLEAIPSL